MVQPDVTAFYDGATATISYVVRDPAGRAAAIIDPVLDFDAESGRTSTASVDRIVDFVEQAGLQVRWILETHAHADHLSAAPLLKQRFGAPVAIGEHITTVQRTFGDVFNLGAALETDGRQFDRQFADGDRFAIGGLDGRVLHTPGHTPACVTYVIGDAAFIGDTLFMPDHGTARADFPGGDARALYRSIQRILDLPETTRLFLCHDYPPNGRDPAWQTTVAEQRAGNMHVHAGRLPAPESNGVSYLKLPVDAL